MANVSCVDNDYVVAANFYAKKLNIPEDTIIGIKLHETIDIAGYCDVYQDLGGKQFFIVGLEKSNDENTIDSFSVLAHEMVHIKQYVNNELVEYDTHCTWKHIKYENTEDMEEYFFSPWEIEAYGMQVGLYHLYLEELEKE